MKRQRAAGVTGVCPSGKGEDMKARDVKPGTKLRCMWYPTFAASVGAQYGVKPWHPQRGEVVTVESVLPPVVGVVSVRERVTLVEYYSSDGFPLSSFELPERD